MMKDRLQTILIAAVAAGSAYPAMILEGKGLPDTSCPAVVDAWQRIDTMIDRIYHHLKNLITEMIRCDAQWWGKFLLFLILCLIIFIIIKGIWSLVSWIRRSIK